MISTMETPPNPSASIETPISSGPPATINPNRLSMSSVFRILGVTTGAFLSGMFLGLIHGMKYAGLRYRAENAHRLPNTSTGWYLYHKSKNYHVILGGVKGGLKMGSKVASLAGGFFMIEAALDGLRGGQDFVSSLAAGLGIAGGFSIWSRFSLLTSARTVKIGVYTGLAFGLVQDALSLARGRRVGYIDFLLGKNRLHKDKENRII